VRDDAETTQPEQVGATLQLRVDLRAKAAERGPQQQAPSLARGEDSAASADGAEDRLGHALHQLQRDVAGEPVGDDDVSGTAGHVVALDVADELERVDPGADALGELLAGLDDEWLPRSASSPLDSSPTRGRSIPSTVLDSAAPMNANWTMCSRRTTTFAPTSSSVTGCRDGSGSASAGR